MRVYIIGAGPGATDLITVRGAELIARCPVVLYTGSLVPKEVIARARPDARVLDSASMTLEEIMGHILDAREHDQDVARVHTGDPLIFSSTAEQMRRMDQAGIEYEVVPGVSSFTAAAAAIGKELTLPELSQTVILTRVEGRTPMPRGQSLAELAKHRATLVLFLSVGRIREVVQELIPECGESCPVAVIQRATWSDQKVLRGTLGTIVDQVQNEKIKATAVILVGEFLSATDFADSRLYSADFAHGFRKKRSMDNTVNKGHDE